MIIRLRHKVDCAARYTSLGNKLTYRACMEAGTWEKRGEDPQKAWTAHVQKASSHVVWPGRCSCSSGTPGGDQSLVAVPAALYSIVTSFPFKCHDRWTWLLQRRHWWYIQPRCQRRPCGIWFVKCDSGGPASSFTASGELACGSVMYNAYCLSGKHIRHKVHKCAPAWASVKVPRHHGLFLSLD